MLFDCNTRTLSALELKTTQGNLTYWREDFDADGKKRSYQIKKNQILGLQKWDRYLMNCGFVINFRHHENRTFFISINDFLDYTSNLSKKSININDVLNMNPIEIENSLLRTNYKYDIEKFLNDIRL